MFKIHHLRSAEYYQMRVIRFFRSKRKLFIKWFETNPAENNITVNLSTTVDDETYHLTIQRIGGLTPADTIGALQAEIDSINATKTFLRAENDALRGMVTKLREALEEIGELAWDVRDRDQAKTRLQQVSEIAGIIEE